MSEVLRLYLELGAMSAFVIFGWFQPRLACRLIQIALTVGFCGFALYGLGMTLLAQMHSPLGGLAASAGAAGLAFVSFRVFEWIIRSRFGD